MEKLANCSTFSGYSNDNAKKFLSEFMSYALLHDLHDYDGKKVAAFHLHLKGPALTRFNALSDFSKRKWESVQKRKDGSSCKYVFISIISLYVQIVALLCSIMVIVHVKQIYFCMS